MLKSFFFFSCVTNNWWPSEWKETAAQTKFAERWAGLWPQSYTCWHILYPSNTWNCT